MWLEHFLLLGPTLHGGAVSLPLGISDGLITLSFFALMVFSIAYFMNRFPDIYASESRMANGQVE
jgi:hypothetical protein